MKLFLGESEVAVFMIFCLPVSFIMSVYATDVLGVNEGDWALYKVESVWHSNIPGDRVTQYLKDINQTEWRLQVVKVRDESVRFSVTINYRNGTKKVEIHEGNVRTGSGNLSMWVVQKSLNKWDKVYEEKELTVNDTKSYPFAGATRQTIFARFTQKETDDSTGEYAIFWDRETGILCGEVVSTVRAVGDYVSMAVVRINIVETSLWEPSADNFWFLELVVIIIVLVLAITFFVQKHRKLKKRKPRKRST